MVVDEPHPRAPALPKDLHPSLLAAFLDGFRNPVEIAADHGISVAEILDFYESEPFRQAIDRHEALAIARARGILTAAYPKAVQVLADTLADPEAPPYARRNASHTITRLVHGAPFPPLRAPRLSAPRARSASEGPPDSPPPPTERSSEVLSDSAPLPTQRASETPPTPPPEHNGHLPTPAPASSDLQPEIPTPQSPSSPDSAPLSSEPALTQHSRPRTQDSSPSPFDDIADWITSPTGPPPTLTPARAAALHRALGRGIAELAALRAKGTPPTPKSAAPQLALLSPSPDSS